jgi:hypothetical protein
VSTPLYYKFQIRNADDSDDLLLVTSVRDGDNPYIAEPPSGDGESVNPLDGKVTVGAYTISVIDALGEVAAYQTVASETFESYADTTALLAAWPETDPDTFVTVTLDTGNPDEGTKAVKFFLAAGQAATGDAYIRETFSGLTPSAPHRVTVRCWLNADTDPFNNFVGLKVGTQLVPMASTGIIGEYRTLTLGALSSAGGALVVDLGIFGVNEAVTGERTFYFDNLTIEEQVTGEGRIVTSVLSDAAARQQLLSKKGIISVSDDGSAWVVLLSGYINRASLVNALRYEFTVGESKRVEQTRKAFDRIPTAEQYATYEARYGSSAMGVMDRASCLIGGPIIRDWGPHQERGRPIFEVEAVVGQYVQLKWVEGMVSANFHEREPPLRDDVAQFINQAALEYLDSSAPIEIPESRYNLAPLPGLVARVYNVSDNEFIADHAPMAKGPENGFLRRMMGDWLFVGGDCRVIVNWTGTLPDVGDRFRLAIFPRAIGPRNPFHWSGHPVDLAAQLFAMHGIAYNTASQTAMRAALGNLEVVLRITESAPITEFLEKSVYGPFGFATRANEDGEAEFFQTRISGQSPVATITLDDLFSDEGTAWEIEEASAANLVTWNSKSFLMNDAAGTVDDSTPIDCVLDADIIVTVKAEDEEGEAVFGEKEVRFDLPGEITGYTSSGDETNPGSLDLFVAAIAHPLFDWNGRGAIHGEFHVGRWSPGYEAVIGEELVVDCPHVPSAAQAQFPTSQRGTLPRRGFILHKTVSPSGATFMLEDRGLAEVVPLVPTFTLAADATFPKKVVEVTVTNEADLLAAAVNVRVEMSTDGSPTAGQFVRVWRPDVDANPFDLPPVCAGSVVSVRMRAEGTGTQAGTYGPWSAFQTLDLDDLDPPTGLAVVSEGTNLTATWTNGEALTPIEVMYRRLSDFTYTITAVLPAGSVEYTWAVPDAETAYVVALRHIDGACRSATVDSMTLVNIAIVLSPPVDPATFGDGLGHHGMEVTATEIPSGTEFWTAVETSVGSGEPCPFVLVGEVQSVPLGRTRLQHPLAAPQDGLLRYWKARHVKPGFEPSAFTDVVSINPWLVIPPNPAPEGENVDPGFYAVPFEIIAHRAGPMPWGFRGSRLTAEVSPLSVAFVTEDWFDLTRVGHVRMTAMVHQTSVPAGSSIAWQYTLDDGETWDYLDGESGPQILVDTASLAADGVLRGEWVPVTDGARADVRLRAVFFGGDETGTLILGGVALQGIANRPDVPIETPEPPIEIPPIPAEDPPPTGCNGLDEMPSFDKLVGWWIADCAEVAVVAGKPTIVQIHDQSGNGNHLTGHGISGQYVLLGETHAGDPITLAGRQVALFDAAYLLFPAGMMDGITDATMTVVLKGLNGDPGVAVNYVYSWKLGSSPDQPIYAGNGNFIFGGGNLGHIHEDFGSTLRHDLGDPSPALDDWRVFSVQGASAKYRTTIDGTEFTDSGTNTVGWAAQGKFGNRGNNSRLAVAEIVIHSGLTEAELEDVVATVGDRWGLTVVGGTPGGDTGTGGDPGQNTGGGPDGNDTTPPPTPASGTRPYGMWALPSTGAGIWTSTVKVLEPHFTPALLTQAAAASQKLFLKPAGAEEDWGRPFNFDAWKRNIDAFANNVAAMAALEAAITSGVAFAHYVMDEHYHPTRYGGPVSLANVQRMCQYSKSIWPNWPTALRSSPQLTAAPDHIDGLDWLWSQYYQKLGDPAQYRDTSLAMASAIGHGLVIGMNVIGFKNRVNGSGDPCTAAEYRHYGGILANSSDPVAFMCWQYRASWFAQTGMATAVSQVEAIWRSRDP